MRILARAKWDLRNWVNMLIIRLLKNLPLITEAPGFDGGGPDRKNIEILKNCVMNKKIFWLIGIIIVLGLGGWWFWPKGKTGFFIA